MAQWQWLTKPDAPYRWAFVARVVLKALALFVIANLLWVLLDPLPLLGRVSVYNTLVPGRARLPYGENAAESYSLSIAELNAAFASHELSRPKGSDEYRVIFIGDSATWGFLLRPAETLTGRLNAADLVTDDDRRVVAYNLGYPEMSLLKDVLLLDRALAYQPDLIVWPITLESMPLAEQTEPFIVQRNAETIRRLTTTYSLERSIDETRLYDPPIMDRTLIGQRRAIADWLRLQIFGFAWAATGIDQHYPDEITLRTSDFDADIHWHEFDEPRDFTVDEIAFDVLAAGVERAGDVPVLLINEPIFVSDGENSDLRYNLWYPRWAYDRYRELLVELADLREWSLLDVWNTIHPDEFTDSPVHMTPAGTAQVADLIAPSILAIANGRTIEAGEG